MATESWIVTGPQILDVEGVTSIQAGLAAGRVSVVGTDEPGVRIEVKSVTGRPLEVKLTDGALTIGYEFLGWDSWLRRAQSFSDGDAVEVYVLAERTIPTRLGGVSAEGLLSGMNADCQVSTASGGLVVDGGNGDLKANTVTGELAVREHTGTVRANTVSGDLTASGDLARVDVNTVSGEVALDLASRTGVVSLRTVSGDQTVRLRPGVGVMLKAHSVSGRVVLDGQDHAGTWFSSVTVDEREGSEGCWLETQTVSGTVTVLHGADGETPAPEESAASDAQETPAQQAPADAAAQKEE